jgi:hypothetical protein
MNISYLLSVLDLYLLNEKNNSLIIEVINNNNNNNNNNLVKVNFSYSTSSLNKTFIKIDKSIFFQNIGHFLEKVQGNLLVIDESIKNINNQNNYIVTFNGNRKLFFVNFSDIELNKIRLGFKDLKSEFMFNKIEIKDDKSYDKKLEENRSNAKLKFSMGFSTYITLFITAIWFLDIFMIALWIFKTIR